MLTSLQDNGYKLLEIGVTDQVFEINEYYL